MSPLSLDLQITFILCSCGHSAFGPFRHGPGELLSYLGIALLDESLDIIPGTSIVVDLNHDDPYRKVMPYDQVYEDCRLFLVAGSFYLCCNAYIWRVGLRRRPRRKNGGVIPFKNATPARNVYDNFYGDGLELSKHSTHHLFGAGKNFNLFRSRSKGIPLPPSRSHSTNRPLTPNDYYVQLFPTSPHEYRRMKFPSRPSPNEDGGGFNPFPRGWDAAAKSNASEPAPSFDTPDTYNNITYAVEGTGNTSTESFFSSERDGDSGRDKGTACCVEISLGRKQVLVGISHVKTAASSWWQRDVHKRYKSIRPARYLSRFYAFDPSPPFDIVARSGFFCLGFADASESRGNPFAGRNEGGDSALSLFDDAFNCPTIHFPSGISEYVGDASKAIISYGVNDCYPRMIVVKKEEIASALAF